MRREAIDADYYAKNSRLLCITEIYAVVTEIVLRMIATEAAGVEFAAV